MAIFVTGSTGYLGSYLAAGLLTGYRDKLNLLIRAKTEQEGRERLWTSLQLHFEFPEFAEYLNTRVRIFRGDLTSDRFGLSDNEYHALVDTTDSLCRFTEPQIGEAVPERQPAGHPRSHSTRAPRAESQRLTPLFARFHG